MKRQLSLRFPHPTSSGRGIQHPQWPRIVFYASGANDPGEIRGFADLGIHVGFSASAIGSRGIHELERHATTGLHLFGDTGAFSEASARGPTTASHSAPAIGEISENAWEARLDTLHRIATTYRRRLSVVAPDRVGDQGDTLARLVRYRRQVRSIAGCGSRILMPIHGGMREAVGFHREAESILNLALVPAFPMARARASPQEILAFTARARPREIHLLGMGLRSPRARHLLPLLAKDPRLRVSMDANLITATVGRRVDGSPARRLTAAQDSVRQRGFQNPFGETTSPDWRIHADYTDSISSPSTWMGPAALQSVAEAAGLSPAQTAQWRNDPDDFLQRRTGPDPDAPHWWESTMLELALDAEWMRYLHRIHAAPRKAQAIHSTFHDHPAARQFTPIAHEGRAR